MYVQYIDSYRFLYGFDIRNSAAVQGCDLQLFLTYILNLF